MLRRAALSLAADDQEQLADPRNLLWVWLYSTEMDLTLQCVEHGLLGEEAALYAKLERERPARVNALRRFSLTAAPSVTTNRDRKASKHGKKRKKRSSKTH